MPMQYLQQQQQASFINALIKTLSLNLGLYNPFGVNIEYMGGDSLLEGKSWGMCPVQLCANYGLVSATSSPYH